MKKSLLAIAALGALALTACTTSETFSVNAPKTAAASTIVSDTVWLTRPKNVGNSSNDYCDHGKYMKDLGHNGNWNVTGNVPHAQCIEVTTTVVGGDDDTTDNGGGEEPANLPPVAVATAAAANVECANYGGAAGVDGSASTDADGSIVSYQWFENGALVGTGATPAITLGLGTHTLTLVVTDDDGATGSDDVTVKIEDTQAPVVSLSLTPGTLWSPNHKYQAITVTASATDVCASNPADLRVSGSAVSNEPDNTKGDGNTTGDVKVTKSNGVILLSSNAAPVVAFNALADKLELRSERSGNLSSRVYTMTLGASDPSGNAAGTSAGVVVPHNK